MPKAPPTFSTLTPTCKDRAILLKTLLRYFGTVAPRASGRYIARFHGVIFWPDFGDAARRSTVWLRSFWPNAAQQRERLSASIPPSGSAYRAWHTKALRRRVLRALGPLLTPITPSGSGDAWVMYRSQQDGFHPRDDELCCPERRALLDDQEQYTVFRRPTQKESTLVRVYAVPPDMSDFLDAEPSLPEEISCLYRAWRTLHLRDVTPFDPIETGLEWTDQGFLFVNWRRFLASPFAPANKLPAEQLPEVLKGGQRRGGVYRLKLAAFPNPADHTDFIKATRLVEANAWGELADPCSIVDPYYLFCRPKLFEPPFHQARKARQVKRREDAAQRAAERSAARKRGEQVPPGRVHKVYPFHYTPWEHVPYAFSSFEKPCWFPQDQHEIAYAIEYRSQLYFRPPTLHPITAASPKAEREAWLLAMDKLDSVDNFQKDGQIGDIEFKSFQLKKDEATREALLPVVREHIENFISFDSLSKQELKRARALAKEKYGLDPATAGSGSDWYNNKVLSVAARRLNPSSVRRRVTVVIPHIIDKETGKPKATKGTFFSPTAIKILQECAKDAPYLYAWATFCSRVAARGILPSTDEEPLTANARWTPAEDLVLLEDYRAHPKMSRAEKASLLKKLQRHDWDAVVRRALQLNKLLKQVLTPSQLERYTVGRLWLPDADTPEKVVHELKRLVILIGVATRHRYLKEKLHPRIPTITKALQLTPDFLDAISLPAYYRTERFEWLAKGEALN